MTSKCSCKQLNKKGGWFCHFLTLIPHSGSYKPVTQRVDNFLDVRRKNLFFFKGCPYNKNTKEHLWRLFGALHFFHLDLCFQNTSIFWLQKPILQIWELKLKKLELPEPYNFILHYLVCLTIFFFAIWTFGFWTLPQKSHSNFFLRHPLGPKSSELTL